MLTTANPSSLPPVRKKETLEEGHYKGCSQPARQPERKTRREEHKAGERERERERERETLTRISLLPKILSKNLRNACPILLLADQANLLQYGVRPERHEHQL
jgi:hypothetical protein